MPAGDAQRVWYPEMLEALAARWSSKWSWSELRDFCATMMEMRRAIRRERGISAPKMKCRSCGAVHASEIPGISIRSALFALKDVGAISEARFKTLDRDWKRHRSKLGLDAYGRLPAETHEQPATQGGDASLAGRCGTER